MPSGASQPALHFQFKHRQLDVIAEHAMLPFCSWSGDE
jgi:hypothetical protein